MLKKAGLPVTLKMRHDAHYIEQLTSYSGAAVGRMIRVDEIRPNPDQPQALATYANSLNRCAKKACWSRCWCASWQRRLFLHYFR